MKPDTILTCGKWENPHTRYIKWSFARQPHTWQIRYRMYDTPQILIFYKITRNLASVNCVAKGLNSSKVRENQQGE